MKLLKYIFLVLIYVILSACAQLPVGYESNSTYILNDTGNTVLGGRASKFKNNNKDSFIYLLNEGTDAFYARRALMSLAERSIDVQYFIWHDDLIGKLLFGGMLEAADRGVRVRILLDDINITSEIEKILYSMDQHKNIEVRLYNPFASRGFRFSDYVTDGFRINRRMHNKSFTVDVQFAVVGGRNIGNEYFAADEESNFEDLDVLSVGPIVQDVGKQFDTYWNSKVVIPVNAFDHNVATVDDLASLKQQLRDFNTSAKGSKYALDVQDSEMYKLISRQSFHKKSEGIYSGKGLVIYDDPEKSLNKSETEIVYLKSLMKPHLENAQESVELISPYFVPGDTGTEYLVGLVKKGIKVRVITNSLSSTDGVMAQSGYVNHRIDLLDGGVELYELKTEYKTKASKSLRRSAKAKSGLHAKTYIFDRKEIFIGSFNFDQRSANINSEVGVVYQVPELANFLASTVFDLDINKECYKVELLVENEDIDGIEVEVKKVVWIDTKDGKQIRYTADPETSIWRRISEDLLSILPIESQL